MMPLEPQRDSIVIALPPHPDGTILPYPGKWVGHVILGMLVFCIFGNCVFVGMLTEIMPEPLKFVGLVVGVLGVVSVVLVFLMIVGYVNAKPYQPMIDRIDDRPDAIVTSHDRTAYCVEVIPPENWANAVSDNGVNIGLLLIDEQNQQLLYESDLERWVIPSEQLVSCDIRKFRPNGGCPVIDDGYVIELRFRVGDTEHTRPIALRPNRITILTGPTRRKNCLAIQSHIRQIVADPPPLDPRCERLWHCQD